MKVRTKSGNHPSRIAFSPDGQVLSVGYEDRPAVDLFDAKTLALLATPDVNGLDNGSLFSVAWSADGRTLFAGGAYTDLLDPLGTYPVLAWKRAGLGLRRKLNVACALSDTATVALASVPPSQLFVAKGNPCFTMRKADGAVLWTHPAFGGDFREEGSAFSVSADGTIIDFGFQRYGKSPLRFDLRALRLSSQEPPDHRTHPPKVNGLQIEDWHYSYQPKLDGKLVGLDPSERSQSLAIQADNRRFVLGTNWALRAFDDKGSKLWWRSLSDVTALNITNNDRLVVAAYGDGTIRWHRMDDGQELLALRVLNDRQNWVAWTPEGFYGATPDAVGMLRWHVNRGNESAAQAVPIDEIPRLNRPDVLPLVLQELEVARAVGVADLALARHNVQSATGALSAPGARLHVLSIGISEYGKEPSLRLKFAAQDAADLARTLFDTQEKRLYTEVRAYSLQDADGRGAILTALDSIIANMAQGQNADLAVIFFAGHATSLTDELYLLPYDVDAGTSATLKATAISGREFHEAIAELARNGRVLVLLDACHSGATDDGSKLTSNADLLRLRTSAANVTVLTSCTSSETSAEDEKWNHGAFTKVLLDALGTDADKDRDGFLSMSELIGYLVTRVPALTSNSQHPGVQVTFGGDLFVASQ